MGKVWLLVLVLAACRAPRPPSFAGGVELPLTESWHGTVFVPVTINGTPLRFLLDTGATITAVTPATAQALGLVGESKMIVNGTIPAEQTHLRQLQIGSIEHQNVRAAIVDLPEERRIDEHFDGVLGLDILAQHDIAIDIPRKRLLFFPATELARSDAVDGMIRVDFDKSRNGLVQFKVDFDEHGSIPAFLDFGAQRTFTNPMTANWIQGGGRGGVRTPHGLNLGDVRWEQFSVIVEDLPIFEHWIRTDELAVILGADLFHDRTVVLSYKDGALFVAREQRM